MTTRKSICLASTANILLLLTLGILLLFVSSSILSLASNLREENSNSIMESAPSFHKLQQLATAVHKHHIRELLKDDSRNQKFSLEKEGVIMDFSRQKMDVEVLTHLLKLAEEREVKNKINKMFAGEKINETENRSVLHVALRQARDEKIGGADVSKDVWLVLDQIKAFTDKIRSGDLKGITGKQLTDVVSIGIGGSYLGPEFLAEALSTDPEGMKMSEGRKLKFLSNVDPVDVQRTLKDCDPEKTLVVVVSKTFTTAETILNAKTVKRWLISRLKSSEAPKYHMCAVSTNIPATTEFGIDPDRVFGFWDWVGGRYSVSSAVGMVPLSLHFGFNLMNEFLQGANSMDNHFRFSPLNENLPVLLALVSVWNSTFLHHSTVAILPYSQALIRFAAHIQQLTMESNGKQVTMDGKPLTYPAGEIFFGEPGTNGQHSFYQLIHQGRIIPCEFIGFCKSQYPIQVEGNPVSNHDELMSNFFAQPDALALGLGKDQLRQNGVPEKLVSHKEFSGDRMSVVMLFPKVDANNLGKLLALYEHRTVVEGFIWGINSFDQWGVELGKVLAKNIRTVLSEKRNSRDSSSQEESKLLSPTKRMLNFYLDFADKESVQIS